MSQLDHGSPDSSATADTTMHSTPLPLKVWLRMDIFILFLIFIFFYYFKLSTFSISIDDEIEALRGADYSWILAGRWGGYLYDRFLVPQSILPFFPVFLFGLNLTLSYPVLLSAFGVRRLGPVHYLAFPLYMAFPTWSFLASFATNIASASIGQLMVVCALYKYHRIINATGAADTHANGWKLGFDTLLASLLFACALGLYQSFFLSFVALGLGIQMIAMRATRISVSVVLRRLCFFLAVIFLGVLIYEIINTAFRFAFNLNDTGYIDGFLNWRALLKSPLSVARLTLESMFDVYAGRPDIYGVTAFAFPIIIICGLAGLLFSSGLSIARRFILFLAALAILCVPFSQHLLAGGLMPTRTLVAVPAVVWLFAVIGMTSRSYALALIAFLSTALALMQIIYTSNLLQAAHQFARIHDQALAAQISDRIVEAHPDFDPRKTYAVDFFGAHPFVTSYPRPPSSTSGFSFFEWDGGNEERILDYMGLIGYANLRTPSFDQRRRDLSEFQQMSEWPSRDSVRIVGDVTLVKLGPARGFLPFTVP